MWSLTSIMDNACSYIQYRNVSAHVRMSARSLQVCANWLLITCCHWLMITVFYWLMSMDSDWLMITGGGAWFPGGVRSMPRHTGYIIYVHDIDYVMANYCDGILIYNMMTNDEGYELWYSTY